MSTVLRYGRVITRERERQLRRYTTKGLDRAETCAKRGMPDRDYHALRSWVYGYERFMCRGLEEVSGVVRRSAVANDAPHPPEHALEHAPQGHEAAP